MSSPEALALPSQFSTPLIPLVIILGPTAVGKTETAILLAERFHGEIVSADSRLFYRGMDIGTAKPTPTEQARIRHHLIDVANPDETWSLGVFQKEADKAIRTIYSDRHLPFLVGGTGQFIRSITEGWNVPAVEPDLRMRTALTQWGADIGPGGLHAKLAILDPMAAIKIDPSNIRRTIRALEVILSTGRRFSDQRQRSLTPFAPLLLGLTCPRVELYRRIDERIHKMIAAGLVEEVQRLLEAGYSPELPTLSAIGYGEIVSYVRGQISLDEAIESMKRRTRIFVRRQANWFKTDDAQIHWFKTGPDAVDEMGSMLEKWLAEEAWNVVLPK